MNIKEKMPKFAFGMMRLPENESGHDIEQVNEMVDIAMANGYNYFDTAYVYDSGRSEETIKKTVVDRYPRESFYLADKLPGWLVKEESDMDRIFNESLQRLGTDYIDFYLLHSLEEGEKDFHYNKFNAYDWALKKKEEGKIKHFGFSFHGTPELLIERLNEHPEIEFVQIQLNYSDWDNPIVESGRLYEILKERNIPIIVMEPVKGGMLANPEPEIREMLKEINPDNSPAALALRFVGSLDGVTTILSGMSSLDQMKENVEIFNNFKPLTPEEEAGIKAVQKKIMAMPTVSCTACRYCVDGCPAGINIPEVIKAVNAERLSPGDSRQKFFYGSLIGTGSARAVDCIECGQCEGVCPQHLPIIEILKEGAETFDNQKK